MKNAPLTQKERDFAENNHYIVYEYLNKHGLNPDEWYDVVIFRYMLSVQKWFACPRLHRWSFKTIAFNGMRSAVGNERKKQKHQIQVISLDELIPGSEDITYMDTITYENLEYKGVYDMNVAYNVLIPDNIKRNSGSKKCDETIAVETFLSMDAKTKNMRFEYNSEEEAKKKASVIRSYIRKKNLKDVVELLRSENCLFIVRKEADKK